jgi:hypothetical protein
LPLGNVFTDVDAAFEAEGVHFGRTSRTLFTPALTLWAFVGQALSPDQSCRAAVARIAVLLVALGRRPCAADTSAYCRARAKLSEGVLQRLTLETASKLEAASPLEWRWKGRRAFLVDGTTITLPDTKANQTEYPQVPAQKPGLGFPILRLVALLSLATAAVHGAAFGSYSGQETGEAALLRELAGRFQPGDVLVGDRVFGSWCDIAMLVAAGVDVVFRLHQARPADFRQGVRLGPDDRLVWWPRPDRPGWIDDGDWQAMPRLLRVRLVRSRISRKGWRTREVVVATTLLESSAADADSIGRLYLARWNVELDLRSLKTGLRMEHLRCQTPEMARKELWAHLLAYNLTRKVAAQAAKEARVEPRRISFTGTAQHLQAAVSQLASACGRLRLELARLVLTNVAAHRVGDRPGRYEPRAVKRRKRQTFLTRPRAHARAELVARASAA